MPDRVLLLTIDSLRADVVSEDTFPRTLPYLNDDFVAFSNAFSHGVATPFAFPALIAGHVATDEGALREDATRINEPFETSAARSNNVHLGETAGYHVGWNDWNQHGSRSGGVSLLKDVVTSSDALRRLYYRSRDFATSRLGVDVPPPYDPANSLVDETESLLHSTDAGLVWSHFMDPHYPFTRGAVRDREVSTAEAYAAGEIEDINERYLEGDVSERELRVLRDLYADNVRFLDRQLSRLFDWLVETDRYSDATIVVTADHGEVFGEHGYYNHQWDADPVDELIHVPLFVKPPGTGHGRTVEANACHLDVYDLIRRRDTDALLDGSFPRTEYIVSKSNAAIRVTGPAGRVIRRRSGESDRTGDVSERAVETAEAAEFPTIENLAGKKPGVTADTDIQDQLQALGYK